MRTDQDEKLSGSESATCAVKCVSRIEIKKKLARSENELARRRVDRLHTVLELIDFCDGDAPTPPFRPFRCRTTRAWPVPVWAARLEPLAR